MAGASNKAPAKTSALVTRDGCLRVLDGVCVMSSPHWMRISVMLCTNKRARGRRGSDSEANDLVNRHGRSRLRDGTFQLRRRLVPTDVQLGARFATRCHIAVARGENQCACRFPMSVALASEPVATPLPDSKVELPPVIRRAEVVAFALVALLIICVVAVLYVAKAFFLPVVDGIRGRHHAVAGRRLSRAASNSRCGGARF